MDRVEQVRTWLNENQVEAAVFRLAENILLLSGYWPALGIAMVVVTANGQAMLVAPDTDEPDLQSNQLTDVRLYPHPVLATSPSAMVSFRLVFQDVSGNMGNGSRRIGYEGSFESIGPPGNFAEPNVVGEPTKQLIREGFGATELVDMSAAIEDIRLIKTEREIERIRIANEIAGFGLEAFKSAVRPGVTEIEVAAEVEATVQKKGVGYQGVQIARSVAQVTSGREDVLHWRYATSRSKVIQEGDTVVIEMGTVADGFWADNTRTVVAGRASDRQREIFAAVLAAQNVAFATSRPGATGGEVDRAARELLRERGLNYPHHTGHGTGFRYHEAKPSIVPNSTDEIKAGMAHVAEPGYYEQGVGGFRIEDDVVVTADGTVRLGPGTFDLD
jgi:Xaa-Pro aminopeptidase